VFDEMCERNEVDDLMKKIEFETLKKSNSSYDSSESSIAHRKREGREGGKRETERGGGGNGAFLGIRGVLGKKRE